jgi:hypothetical protein
LFGGPGQLPPEQEAIYNFLMNSAKSARRYGNSPIMSAPQEIQARDSMLQQFNQQFGQQQQGLLAMDPGLQGNAQANRVGSLASRQQAGAASIDTAAILNSLNQHFNMKYSVAPSIASSALGAANAPRYGGGDLSGSLGNLFSTWAFYGSRNQPPAGGGGGGFGGINGGGPSGGGNWAGPDPGGSQVSPMNYQV